MSYLKDFVKRFSAPALPTSPPSYEQQYQDKLNSVLRLFFNELTNALQAVFGIAGGRYINTPFGDFTDDTDQFAANTTTAYAIQINTVEDSNAISIQSGSRITVDYNGLYEIFASVQFTNTDSNIADINIWFSKNGVNVPNSNSILSIVGRHGTDDGRTIAIAMLLLDLHVGDYAEVYWQTNNTAVFIEHIGATTTPDRPAVPSVILSVKHVSNVL